MIKNWILAARPKTLFVSMSPVIVAISLVIAKEIEFQVLPAIICFLFAISAQIISNLANDYADGVKGTDDENRLGPKRMVASGLISKKAMQIALVLCFGFTGLLGLSLVYWGGWVLVPVGVVIFIAAFSYSAGPFPLSYHALGDIAVVLFYGLVPVVFTYFVLCGEVCRDAWLAGIAMGLVADELLIVNNYRDVEQDKVHGKKTTVAVFGKKAAQWAFLLNPIIAVVISGFFIASSPLWVGYGLIFIGAVFRLWKELKKSEGAALNKLLPKASMLSICYAIMVLLASVIRFK